MTDEQQYTLEGMALDHYAHWWLLPEEGSKYPNRWEKLVDNVREGEISEVSRLIREAHATAYIAGAVFRITGE